MGFYAPARIVRDACDHGVDTSYYNWCKIAQIAATENSDPHVDPYMSCEKVPGFNLEYKLAGSIPGSSLSMTASSLLVCSAWC
jgi:hypothetical protein